jgi:hypothetical protein
MTRELFEGVITDDTRGARGGRGVGLGRGKGLGNGADTEHKPMGKRGLDASALLRYCSTLIPNEAGVVVGWGSMTWGARGQVTTSPSPDNDA